MHSACRLVGRSGIDKAHLLGAASLVLETETLCLGWTNLEPSDQGATGAGVCLSLTRAVFLFFPRRRDFSEQGEPGRDS
jgi:hypothetical protein